MAALKWGYWGKGHWRLLWQTKNTSRFYARALRRGIVGEPVRLSSRT